MRDKRRKLLNNVQDSVCERTADTSKDEGLISPGCSELTRLVLHYYQTELKGALREAARELLDPARTP